MVIFGKLKDPVTAGGTAKFLPQQPFKNIYGYVIPELQVRNLLSKCMNNDDMVFVDQLSNGPYAGQYVIIAQDIPN